MSQFLLFELLDALHLLKLLHVQLDSKFGIGLIGNNTRLGCGGLWLGCRGAVLLLKVRELCLGCFSNLLFSAWCDFRSFLSSLWQDRLLAKVLRVIKYLFRFQKVI